MLRSLSDLERYRVDATDGDVGTVANFFLDDERWGVRYLVVETGGFFAARRVLISPLAFREVDWSTQRFHLALTKDKVNRSPSVDVDMPVSRQHEREYSRYYGYPYYWGSVGIWGFGASPAALTTGRWDEAAERQAEENGDSHLRSANEIRGYHVRATDNAIGHVSDFVIDDEAWVVRYFVLNTSNWGFGKKVLIAPHWVNQLSWPDRQMHVDLSSEGIRNSPEWDPNAAINREYEARLYDYYGRPVYWDSADQPSPSRRRYEGVHPA
jgi:hypothetical protein